MLFYLINNFKDSVVYDHANNKIEKAVIVLTFSSEFTRKSYILLENNKGFSFFANAYTYKRRRSDGAYIIRDNEKLNNMEYEMVEELIKETKMFCVVKKEEKKSWAKEFINILKVFFNSIEVTWK